jgi:hypothetical protein
VDLRTEARRQETCFCCVCSISVLFSLFSPLINLNGTKIEDIPARIKALKEAGGVQKGRQGRRVRREGGRGVSPAEEIGVSSFFGEK